MEEKKTEEMSTDEVNATELVLRSMRKFTDPQFEKMLAETLKKHPIERNYTTRCYCRRCNTAWDMTERGARTLREQSPNGEIKIPEGMSEQDLGDLSKFVFIIEPCFICRGKTEKIQSEARLKAAVSVYRKNKHRTKTNWSF